MLSPVTHILPLTSIRRVRMLPVEGRVLVRSGQTVTANDIIAEAYIQPDHILLDIQSVLGTRHKKGAGQIERKSGERVEEGDIIAASRGLFRKEIRAPAKGAIAAMSSGQVWLKVHDTPHQLKAGYAGKVAEVIPDRGVILEVSGVLVQGVWGNTKINIGPLAVAASSPDDKFSPDRLSGSMRHSIVLAGFCNNAKVLKAAQELSIRGLILGSMASDLIPVANHLEIPIILLEGFGRTPINNFAYKLLTTNEKRLASINAAPWNPATGDRPEIVIPLPASGEVAAETDIFKTGQSVRINTPPYNGQVGKLEALLPGMTQLPNGIRTRSATILLENSAQITIPLANMDVIE